VTPERWQQVKEIFSSALGRDHAARPAFLTNVCGEDQELRREVETLLAAHEKDGSFIDSPVYRIASTSSEVESELTTGQLLGSYEILSTLGAGGMGEVYLAEDHKLGRKVAIKLLPLYLSEQSERRRRFEQEARAASALNHPNILTIHEIGQVDGRHFIATELVEGQTLRQRISHGRMEIAEVLDVAFQVAGALRAAHAAGIVHRDIKPENLMVRPDGIVKVLDFGLAKLTEQAIPSKPDATTRALVKTGAGMVMGTAQYMSPEQAQALEVDARSDIWSFGCVLYEMLVGHAAFEGATTSHVVVSILEKEPAWHDWPAGEISAELEWTVRKALRKDKEERYQTAKELLGDLKSLKQRSEFSAELERTTPSVTGSSAATATSETPQSRITEGQSRSTPSQEDHPRKTNKRERSMAAVILLLLTVATALGIYKFAIRNKQSVNTETSVSTSPAGPLKATQITSGSGLDLHPSLSPDGNSIAYSSDHGSGYEIYIRQLTPGGREIQLTSDGTQNFEPAWSPDGKLIAYHSKNRGGIWIVPALGGVAKQLTEFGSNPAWSPDGGSLVLQSSGIGGDLFAMGSGALLTTTLWTISSQGGTPKQITVMGSPEGGHGSPSWSPDGKRIVFASYDPAKTEIWTISAAGDQLKRLARGLDPIYAPDGEHIYFVSFGTASLNFGLSKVRVSPETGELLGQPLEIASTGPARIKRLTVSADGKRIAYTPLTVASNLWSVNVPLHPREATPSPVSLTNDTSYRNSSPVFSPDGKKVAYHVVRVGGKPDIWLIDPDGKNATQLTTDPAGDQRPSWFPDGEEVAFVSNRQGKDVVLAINRKTGKERTLFEAEQDITFPRLSPDGKQIVFNSKKSGTTNIWLASIENGAVKQLTFDKESIGFPCWSPDGQFLAFEVKRGDDTHVGVMTSAGGDVLQLTSARGQSWPHTWSPDGDKIAFAGFRDGYWNIWWVSRTSKALQQVTNYMKLNAFVRYPAWSPDGSRIVYEYTETSGNIWLMDLK
jgi:eukaryotic-like serine/threonine-protein kinase